MMSAVMVLSSGFFSNNGLNLLPKGLPLYSLLYHILKDNRKSLFRFCHWFSLFCFVLIHIGILSSGFFSNNGLNLLPKGLPLYSLLYHILKDNRKSLFRFCHWFSLFCFVLGHIGILSSGFFSNNGLNLLPKGLPLYSLLYHILKDNRKSLFRFCHWFSLFCFVLIHIGIKINPC